MQIDEKTAALEAILFAGGEPVELLRLAEAAEVEEETVPKLIQLLNDRYEASHSALIVLKLNQSYQLTTRAEYGDYIKRSMENKKSAPLSSAAMEVLTIVAYNQPVTKSFIEHIRGVDSSSVVNALTEKKLLEEAGRLEIPGRPIAYRTTTDFLRCFQLSSLEELPPLPSHNEQVSFDEISVSKEEPV